VTLVGKDISKWRQGVLLSIDAITDLKLYHPDFPAETVVVVVSHDCDIAQDVESHVEVVVGHKVVKSNGSFTHGKNPRKLHIQYQGEDQSFVVELVQSQKTTVNKQTLFNYTPAEYKLSSERLNILQIWLSSRYLRAAYPDGFNDILKTFKIGDKISKILERQGSEITAIFFDIDNGEELEKAEGDTYQLYIYVLHSDKNYEQSLSAAEQVKKDLHAAFKEKLHSNTNGWQGIELTGIEVTSEFEIKYGEVKAMKKHMLDHLSLKADPQQPVLQV
jgi:hypothetical protein